MTLMLYLTVEPTIRAGLLTLLLRLLKEAPMGALANEPQDVLDGNINAIVEIDDYFYFYDY